MTDILSSVRAIAARHPGVKLDGKESVDGVLVYRFDEDEAANAFINEIHSLPLEEVACVDGDTIEVVAFYGLDDTVEVIAARVDENGIYSEMDR